MPHLAPQDDHSREPLLRRLDRAAAEINPYLLLLAIGLVILDLTCVAALLVSNLPVTRMSAPPAAAEAHAPA